MKYLRSSIQLAELAMHLGQAGDTWHAPLIRAVLTGELRVILVPPGERMPLSALDMSCDRRPLVVVLAGDGDKPAGPGDFPQAQRLFRWAGFVMIHGAAGQAAHYEVAVQAARRFGRVVIAETAGAYLKDWCAFKLVNAPRMPGIIIAVPEGEPQHPIQGAPAGAVLQ